MTNIFNQYIQEVFNGNQASAAKALSVTSSTVCRILNGQRGITPQLAAKLEQLSGGKYKKEAFIWPEDRADQTSGNQVQNEANLGYISPENKKPNKNNGFPEILPENLKQIQTTNNNQSALKNNLAEQQNPITATISSNIKGEKNANDANLHGTSEKICDAKRCESFNHSTHSLCLNSEPNLAPNAIGAESSAAKLAADASLKFNGTGGSNAAGFHSFNSNAQTKKRGRPPKFAPNSTTKTAPSEQQKQDLAVQIAQSAQGVISLNPPTSAEDLNVIIAVQLAPIGAQK